MVDLPMHLVPKPALRGWSHRIAFVAAVILCPFLIIAAEKARGLASLYSLSIVGLFGVSSTYHGHNWSERMHEVWRRCDHAVIFIVIAATYTPIAWLLLSNTKAVLVLLFVWVGAFTGVLIMMFWPTAPKSVLIPLIFIVGWSALLVIDDLWRELSALGFVLLILGGVLHTSGAIVYGTQRPDPWPSKFGFHEIFHLLVVFATVCHYIVIAFIALPNA